MNSFVASKDIIFAFFGLFLSVIFTQGLFGKILSFVHELAHSIIPFGYEKLSETDGKLTKSSLAKLNGFEIERSHSLKRIHKSISCNAAIAMTLLTIATTSASFKFAGAEFSNFSVIWSLFLILIFVYANYYGWILFRKNDYWEALPPMSSSKYNIILTITMTLSLLYIVLIARNAFYMWLYFPFSILFIYFTARIHRIPHINLTHRRAEDFSEGEEHYLQDIGREFCLISILFLGFAYAHINGFGYVRSTWLGEYVELHPVRTFLVIFLVPFAVFFVNFVRCVHYSAMVSFLLSPKKKTVVSIVV